MIPRFNENQALVYPFRILLLLMLINCVELSAQTADANKSKPNVLFIAVDDLNTWLGCLNKYVNASTPNIDRLASQGVLFSNAHCQAPLCGPSRASIMSGLRPSTTGIYGMIGDNRIRDDNAVTRDVVFLPEYFSNNGYHTMGIGKLFHDHAPDGLFNESGGRVEGFGPLPATKFVWDGMGNADPKRYQKTSTDWGAFPNEDSLMPDHQSASWAIDKLNRNYNKPFFLAVGFLRPHVPLYVPQKWFDKHPLSSIKLAPYRKDDLEDIPDVGLRINDLPQIPTTDWAIANGEWEKIIQAYMACVSFVDYEIGRVLDALSNSEHATNTVIVLWSDHGYRLGEKGSFAKHALWESATKAPLIISAPGLPKGKIINEPVELLSLYPTLLELCRLPKYERNEGRSLVSTVLAKKPSANAYAITTYGMNNHAVATDRFRYIRYEDGTEELYDHRSDPNEFNNIEGNADYKKQIESLRLLLPVSNAKWHKHSSYNFQPYFIEQKQRVGIQ